MWILCQLAAVATRQLAYPLSNQSHDIWWLQHTHTETEHMYSNNRAYHTLQTLLSREEKGLSDFLVCAESAALWYMVWICSKYVACRVFVLCGHILTCWSHDIQPDFSLAHWKLQFSAMLNWPRTFTFLKAGSEYETTSMGHMTIMWLYTYIALTRMGHMTTMWLFYTHWPAWGCCRKRQTLQTGPCWHGWWRNAPVSGMMRNS